MMKTDPTISRALRYPYNCPDHDFIIDKGSLLQFEEESCLETRIPVLAIGSNRSPEQLIKKFGDKAIIPVTVAQLCDYDVVYAAHIASYGSVPAVLTRSLGTIVEVALTWLSEIQLERMHETEAVGVNYNYGVARTLNLRTNVRRKIENVGCYLGRRGSLNVNGNTVALQEIKATNRVLAALSQSEILEKIYSTQSKEKMFEVWLRDLIKNKESRQRLTDKLTRNAKANFLSAFEVLNGGDL